MVLGDLERIMPKHVYYFGGKTTEGNGKMKQLLGGKGANLAEMNRIGLPVPPGFTITTEVCDLVLQERPASCPPGLMDEVASNVAMLEKELGKKFGDTTEPAAGLRPLRRRRCRCPA